MANAEELVKKMAIYLGLNADELWVLRAIRPKRAKARKQLPSAPKPKKKYRLSRDMTEWRLQLAAELSASCISASRS